MKSLNNFGNNPFLVWKLSRHSENFQDNIESVHTICKVYRQPGNFLDNQ